MKSYVALIRTFISLLGVMLTFAAFSAPCSATAEPQVVRKKFAAQPVAGQPATKVADVKPQEPPAPAPPKPVPPPPTRTAEVAPAAAETALGEPQAKLVMAQTPASVPEAPARAAVPGVAKPAAEIQVTDSQVAALLNIQAPPPYSPKGKVDPFEPLLRDESAQPAAAKLIRKKREAQSPLEKIDLGQLKLVAIVAAATGNRALVEESSGKGYILKEGTYVGLNSGKVVDISLEKVLIEEEYEDVYGKTITQKKEITLPKPPGEL